MLEADVKIIGVQNGEISTDVEYIAQGRTRQGSYMDAVLEAAVKAHLKYMPDVKRFLKS